MRLYIWNDPYRVKYGGAIVYVVAETEEQARDLARNSLVSHFGMKPESGGCDLGDRPPTRVLELPCAEIYEWRE